MPCPTTVVAQAEMHLICSGACRKKAAMSPVHFFKTKVGKDQLLRSFKNSYAAQESHTMTAFENEAARAAAVAAGDLWV